MKRTCCLLIASVFCLLLLISCSTPFRAVVSSDEARFVFPISERSEWEWNRATTRDNVEEYGWTVAVRNGEDTYEFGFFLFKHPTAVPQQGNLDDLLMSGQASLGSGGQLIEDAGIQVVSYDNQLIVIVRGRQNIERLFSSRPKDVIFQIVEPQKLPKRKKITVTYSN
ncbi:MAG: hypothetical protein KAU12_03010 [Candidatus Omnitrophica bacterium]|nr:hypothetical protein [Candidatus Omnitrophota bacterium]